MAKKKHPKTRKAAHPRASLPTPPVESEPAPSLAAPAEAGGDEVARASALMAAGQYDKAKEILELALEADPAHRSALETLGRLHMARQDFDSAVRLHNRLVVLYAPDPKVHNALGISLLMAGRADEALIHLTRCTDLEPGNLRAMSNLAKAFMMKGSWGQAQELLEKAFLLSEGKQSASLLELLEYCHQQQARGQEQACAG